MTGRTYQEDQIQAAIVRYVRTVASGCICAAIPNGGLRDKREAARLKWTGTLAGMPDLILLGPDGAVIGLEVKSDTGRLSDAQKAIAEQWRALGYGWAVVRSVDDVRAVLADAGIRTREVAQ